MSAILHELHLPSGIVVVVADLDPEVDLLQCRQLPNKESCYWLLLELEDDVNSNLQSFFLCM